MTETPAKDLTDENLAKFDVMLLNYKDTRNGGPDTRWSDANKKAFADAVRGGKGLVVYHHASSAFVSGTEFDKEFERVIAGGWRKQGNHGKRHEFSVTVRNAEHPITRGMPREWMHNNDELYDNMRGPIQNVTLLATAYSKGTRAHEPMIWTVAYGAGRVFHTPMGHDVNAMKCVGFAVTLLRGTEWAATANVTIPIPSNFPTEKDVSVQE